MIVCWMVSFSINNNKQKLVLFWGEIVSILWMYVGLVVASGYFQNSVLEKYHALPTSQPSDGQQENTWKNISHKLQQSLN